MPSASLSFLTHPNSREERRTIKLLQDTLDRAGAASAGHGDVELVVMFSHCEGYSDILSFVVER
jgi:hypothetical protein